MERPNTFKAEYKKRELNDLFKWFETRMDRLPASLQVDEGTYSPDLRATVTSLMHVIRAHTLTISQSGYVAQLMLIRERLKEEGVE